MISISLGINKVRPRSTGAAFVFSTTQWQLITPNWETITGTWN